MLQKFTLLKSSYDGSCIFGGLTTASIQVWPITDEHNLAELNFFNSTITFGSRLTISRKPARAPHL